MPLRKKPVDRRRTGARMRRRVSGPGLPGYSSLIDWIGAQRACGPLTPIQTVSIGFVRPTSLTGAVNIAHPQKQPPISPVPQAGHSSRAKLRRPFLRQTFSSQMWPVDSPVQGRGSGFALSHSVPPNTCVFGQIRLAEAQPISGRKAPGLTRVTLREEATNGTQV